MADCLRLGLAVDSSVMLSYAVVLSGDRSGCVVVEC